MNAGKVSLLRSQSDARGSIDKTRTLSTIICKKIFHWEEAMLRRCRHGQIKAEGKALLRTCGARLSRLPDARRTRWRTGG